ncbi:MAG: hypothetical protein NTV36_00780 [Candidatus Staskawiczbacteria bacterium]|nr:hypothetical protein [Candidatus Staskawiczbacteria bacterium]
MQKQKGISSLAIILIIVGVVIIIGGGIFTWQYFATKPQPKVTQTQVQTVGQKTYTNAQYEFEFNYPSDSTVLNDNSGGAFLADYDVSCKDSINDNIVSVMLYKKSVADSFGWTLANQNTPEMKYIENESGNFVVRISRAVENGNDCKDVYNTVSSTFKFTNSTPQITNPITGWQTYTNTQYGFSFQYPSDYQQKGPENTQTISGEVNIANLYGNPDKILIFYYAGPKLDLSSAKYGPEHLWYDSLTGKWMIDLSDEIKGTIVTQEISPSFAKSGLIYFEDHHGVYSNDIISLSHSSFIIMTVGDSGPGVDIMDNIVSTFKFTK